MSKFNIGDRVCVLYHDFNGDWNMTGATIGIIKRFRGDTTEVFIINPKKKVRYKKCNVATNCLVSEELYNSPLYQALR